MRKLEKETGTVYLVGAGPGDPELISVRGLRLLQQADVLVYDRLVHPDLIDAAPAKTEKIYVGKAGRRKSMPQETINKLLIDRGRKNRVVVRLKGGDPFVYGRGSEEARELRAAGIPFEVVPGISSAVAVPAYAGIPLTHRGIAQSFTVVTGHTALNTPDTEWASYINADTLVVLMGLGKLPTIAAQLMRHGKPAYTPVAVISQGSTAAQQTVTGNLVNIADKAAHLPTPAIIVIGDVVHLHEEIDWFGMRPEAGSGIPSSNAFTEHIYAVSA